MVGAVVVSWTLGRIFGGLHHQLAVVRLIVVRICFGLVLAIVTVQAALAGGFWLLLASVCGLLALSSFAMAAVVVRVGPAENCSMTPSAAPRGRSGKLAPVAQVTVL